MTHILVTFLGAPDSGRPPALRQRPGYQEIVYDFRKCTPASDPSLYKERFFPFALREHLEKTAKPIQELVIFGTTGSAWDELLRMVGGGWLQQDDLDEIRRQAFKNAVKVQELDTKYAEQLRKTVRLKKVQLKEIGYADTLAEQVTILSRLYDVAEKATAVTIDVTHGLRYLPLLGSLAAYVLGILKVGSPVAVNVWYGAYDMRKPNSLGQDEAPAIELGGHARIVDWLAAFQNFQWDGDYWAFAEALKHENENLANTLAEAAFLDRRGRIEAADRKFKEISDAVANAPEGTMIGLFHVALQDRLTVIKKTEDALYNHQRALTFHHLDHEDVVHAAIWGREAAVTRMVPAMRARLKAWAENQKQASKNKFLAYLEKKDEDLIRIRRVRDQAVVQYGNCKTDLKSEAAKSQREAWECIKNIRNEFAHAVHEEEEDADTAVPSIPQDVDACKEALRTALASFLKDNDARGATLLA